MLFNSVEFLFLFLPVTLGIFLILRKIKGACFVIPFLGMASLFFYGWWNYKYLALILCSIGCNYLFAQFIHRQNKKKPLLVLGVIFNLGLIAWFKYANFLLDNVAQVTGYNAGIEHIILPLGISFFTFQQIAYLVDIYQGKAQAPNIARYTLFVTFFPQLIAGPIVHHKNMMSQFSKERMATDYDWGKAAVGLTIFSIGLFKKVMLADQYALYASPIFQQADQGHSVMFTEGWIAALSYTLQLYFDFSGYSDMAIGLGLFFGICLPINFLSPYKAKNIIDFWKRWHITLSTFLKDYLYIPLGGNRKGTARRYSNLMITMLLGGLWHGAGWNFVLWGGLHGLYLSINHAWQKLPFAKNYSHKQIYTALAAATTMIAVIISWVIFRSETLSGAGTILTAMISLGSMPTFDSDTLEILGLVFIGFLIVLRIPNSLELTGYKHIADGQKMNVSWKLMILTTGLLTLSLFTLVYNQNRISEFIYFQF
jgi:D-alanyl-lipoteichoic acid acyltransferase DltB (MBOAT superfamily)